MRTRCGQCNLRKLRRRQQAHNGNKTDPVAERDTQFTAKADGINFLETSAVELSVRLHLISILGPFGPHVVSQ